MAVVDMVRRNYSEIGYEFQEVIADGTTGDDVHISPLGRDGSNITCLLIAGAGTGRFEYTTSSDADVLAQTAIWNEWGLGDSTGTVTDAVISQVSGLRGVSVSGEITIQIMY